MLRHANPQPTNFDSIQKRLTFLLQGLSMQLNVPVERGDIQRSIAQILGESNNVPTTDVILGILRSAQSVRIRLAPVHLDWTALSNLLADDFKVAAIHVQPSNEASRQPHQKSSPWWILDNIAFSRVEAIAVVDGLEMQTLNRSQLQKMLLEESGYSFFVAQPALFNEFSASNVYSENDDSHLPAASTSVVAPDHTVDAGHHHHLPPLRRLLRLLRPERSDLFSISIFSFVSVVLGLAVPLTVEVLVNTIGFGRNFQAILVIALMLMSVLALSGAFKLLQTIVVELMQRRFFVRFVGDLAYRLPNASRSQLLGVHGPELLNRYFDIMTIQKGTATLLTDGLTIVMQTLTGTLLLAFYHPYLLGFDLVLLISMTLITYLLGRGGIRTAINESVVKYSIAHWLQDVVAAPTAFKLHGGSEMSSDRANRLVVQYLAARKRHFVVLMRQMVFAVLLQVIAMTALFALGGYLVLIDRLTLGQLVAAELVIAVIVGAFAKSGKLIESFYDLMSAVDKVGHLLDLSVDAPLVPIVSRSGPAAIRTEALTLIDPANQFEVPVGSLHVPAGGRLAIVGYVGAADSMLLPAIAGLIEPKHGFIEIDGLDSREALRFSDGSLAGYAGPREIFAGTIADNIRLGRSAITEVELRDALETVDLWEELLTLRLGLETRLQTGGFPLCEDQIPRLMIARAIAGRPRLLLIDWCLDYLPAEERIRVWKRLADPSKPWTLLITTHDPEIIKSASQVFKFSFTTPKLPY